ncbi:MAG: malate dehydrogenase [Nitrospirae bacterium]|nr:MAG: malate dehydrogenase [Nitrospirae bacterium 13_2_20CM_62_7]OLB57601.1 MAG: malate dehydrogenase [Nitrospirae bacterium 13_2_20CM_2_62_8]TLY41091.1 MAG: malate dehydrogenase [Nitrospirota bacterium]TLY43172.1 MAG: malate dehydrogenase [Nitrospirota bacterium]
MRKKITIIGSGNVGATTALWAALKELGDIVLFNRTKGLAEGRALDLKEASPLEGFDLEIVGTDRFEDTRDSDVVVITAGLPRQPGMSREELLNKNASIVGDLCAQIAKFSPHAVLIVVTNPVDAMVHVVAKATDFPKNRIVGMAGILDSSRFRTFIALELGVSVEDINALVLGGHGDFMVPLPRHASVSGIPITDLLSDARINALIERTRHGGAEILSLQKVSSAFYAPAAAIEQMVETIVRDKKRVLPCVAYLHGEYGIDGIFMGVPVLLGANGVERVLELKLNAAELQALRKSADAVRKLVAQISL